MMRMAGNSVQCTETNKKWCTSLSVLIGFEVYLNKRVNSNNCGTCASHVDPRLQELFYSSFEEQILSFLIKEIITSLNRKIFFPWPEHRYIITNLNTIEIEKDILSLKRI